MGLSLVSSLTSTILRSVIYIHQYFIAIYFSVTQSKILMENVTNHLRGRPREFNKARALDAALILFWSQGYEGTSITQLTKAMKINAPSLYAAFGSKEQLYYDVLNQYVTIHGDPLVRALFKRSTVRNDVKQMLIEAAKQFSRAAWPQGCLIANGALRCGKEYQPVAKATASLRILAKDALKQRLDQAITDGEIARCTDIESLAAFYSSVVQGMSVQAVDGATRKQLIKIVEYAMAAWPANENGRSASEKSRDRNG